MIRCAATLLVLATLSSPPRADRPLFDFEEADEAARWSPYELTREKAPSVRVEQVEQGATSGNRALKLTFDGGLWPAVSTDRIPVPGDWREYQTILADVTTDRRCLVGFRILQARSLEPEMIKAYDGRSWWDRTAILEPGRNEIRAVISESAWGLRGALGAVVRIVVYAYKPERGLSVIVDNLRLSAKWPGTKDLGYFSPYSRDGFSTMKARAWAATGKLPTFRLSGTDLDVGSVIDLGKSRKDGWTPPRETTFEAVESGLRGLHEALRKDHPGATLTVLRDGENGYEGWRDTHISSHGPDGPNEWRTRSHGTLESIEAFMRHRSVLMKVDLSPIPHGSKILAARLLLTRTDSKLPAKPNCWIAEPCARPWVENEANGYEYANGRLWKAVNGTYYGDDPDFLPLFLAHGPAGSPVSVWDFTEAVRFWTDGKRENHGFMLHGDSHDYMKVHSREAKDVKKRPALAVIHSPG